ncbi:glutamate dehydrogenase [Actinomycetospora sp. NBRC 106375]|uniref:NAD-glutamate dehydrogenase n=1 Tax=Actinomycetospora sp. NBRC 106375 TaxID=3032207 RepID=UPI0024A228A1|nr:NAD-glutamate dehydrogenase [Actinomycetospora sp. NBRC 106375]GLZ47282.1 glutamate dehydrogenase [Actinomycetospora sp. NBRC 106375]
MTATTSRAGTDAARGWPAERHTLRAVAAEADPPDSELGELAVTYFDRVPDGELVADPADALATVRAHRSLARLRVPGKPVTAVLDTPGAAGRISVLVVTDDMPFLIDSVLAELDRTGASVHRVVHPVVVVRRDVRGELLDILPMADAAAPPPGTVAESWMNIELGDLPGSDPARDLAADLHARLSGVLTDVREVVEDGDRMVSTARALADELAASGPGEDSAETADTVALLRWFAQGNLILLGYRRQEVVDTPEGPALRGVLATGLGVLRRDSLVARTLTASPDSVSPAGVPGDATPRRLLVLTRASARSTVHRPEHPLYVGVSIHDDEGRLVGEHRFLGILTVAARHADVLGIPVVSRRVQEVVAEAGLPVDSWSGQRLLEVLQTYPRAELLCTDRASLEATATGVLDLAERRRVRLFLRRDPYGRYFSCMIYLPRDRYTTAIRTRMQDVLMRELRGTDLEHTARVTEDQLALLHVTVHTGREEPVTPDLETLTAQLAEAARTWSDRLREQATGEERAVLATIGEPFAESYKEDFGPERGLLDLRVLDGLTPPGAEGPGRDTAVRLYRPTNPDAGDRRLKLYLAGRRATLSSVLPALQSLGVVVVDERPYEVTRSDGVTCWINDFGLRLPGTDSVPPGTEHDLTERFAEAFDTVWSGHVGADGFNALVLSAGLTWRQAAVLRAFSRYQRQIGSPYGQSYITDVAGAHRDVAVGLVELFEARFDPALSPDERDRRVAEVDGRVTTAIADVTSLDADRILRSLLGVVRATLRTNFFRRDAEGAPRPFLALKLDPAQVPGVPEPVPAIETFVHSNRVEGVHLRFGPIARGGLRWSDRLQDYRTEILGLVKAQAVKNAVIVPVGAKGGFVVKRPPAATGDAAVDRDAARAEGVACYRMFVSGLLDLVDDRAGHAADSAVRTPEEVVRYDGDDTYLVVAADKGTATFSDTANAVAGEYGFWLGDAFASGGSVGYDHKAMGITARGAWESVRRHFRELDRDLATDEITVVGVGDMSGDVFGNGMLLSEHLRIVAAFDHRHVFLDPDPDPAVSFAERRRLFELSRSSWADYDTSLISEGGGVYPRTMKAVPVSPEAARALGADPGEMDPPTLVRAILRAPADLLWNGGIGTYVKASTETHADVGDKTNDAVRVDGDELRVAVVGEGGNLGLTQLGRIEYDHHGGKVNTDAVDNSAGVDCSDHEVNIKILLDSLVERGELGEDERDEQIAATTDDVAALVLADNVAQNEVLGVSRAHAAGMMHVHRDLVADLEARGRLDRELDVLPDEEGFELRLAEDEGLTSPELCTLMAHVKLDLTDALTDSELPDLEVFSRRLPAYFPAALAERYPDAVAAHPLRRQIVTTMLSNTVVDGGGLSYVYRLVQEVAASPADAVRAYHVATSVFGLDALAADLAAADMPVALADRLTLQARRQLDRAARWFLTRRPQPLAVGAETQRFAPTMRMLAPRVPDMLRGEEAEGLTRRVREFTVAGAPEDLARRAVGGLYAFGVLDVTEIVEIAEREQGGVLVDDGEVSQDEVIAVAELYYALSAHLGLDALLTAVAALDRTDRWHALARLSLRDELYSSLRAITLDVLADTGPEESADEKIEHWEQANASRLMRARTALAEIAEQGRADLATVSVAARQIRSMVR